MASVRQRQAQPCPAALAEPLAKPLLPSLTN